MTRCTTNNTVLRVCLFSDYVLVIKHSLIWLLATARLHVTADVEIIIIILTVVVVFTASSTEANPSLFIYGVA